MIAGIGGKPELTWEDVMGSVAGIEQKHEGLIRYVYLDDPGGKHDFFAGLMMEACARQDVQQWAKRHPGEIEALVRFAIREWKYPSPKYNGKTRAAAFDVTYHDWRRKYQTIYNAIAGIPTYWEDQVIQRVKRQLRR